MLSKTTKNRFFYKLDKIFWWILSLLPFFIYIPYCFCRGELLSLDTFFTTIFDITYNSSNAFTNVLNSLFGSTGVFPLLNSNWVIRYFAYAATVEVIHVCFDVIVFIPRLCHKWISKAVQDD